MTEEKIKKELEIQISWPGLSWPNLSFPPVNLTISVPAWFFYATPAERDAYFKELLND